MGETDVVVVVAVTMAVALALMAAVWAAASRLDTSDVVMKWHRLTISSVVRGFLAMGDGIHWGIIGPSLRIASHSISISICNLIDQSDFRLNNQILAKNRSRSTFQKYGQILGMHGYFYGYACTCGLSRVFLAQHILACSKVIVDSPI